MNYKIVTLNNVSILMISGNIGKDDKEALNSCSNELLTTEAASVILYFKNVTSIEVPALRELTLLQHEIRKTKTLKVVGLNLQLKTYLTEKGVIRGNELGTNLNEVLFSLNKPG